MIEMQKRHKCHGGSIGYYCHDSHETKTPMRFSLFEPPESQKTGLYVIFLSGLTCTEENFTAKANAYQKASALGLCILAADTSPRGETIPDVEAYDLGQGAGFYLDALQKPWAENFRMESYLMQELLPLCEKNFDLNPEGKSITGHSMGGHGALTLYLKYPGRFRSCSAFAPITAPSQVPWGQKAFGAYLGDAPEEWQQHDATELVKKAKSTSENAPILIDQGLEDDFLAEQLKPELFAKACEESGQALTLRYHEGYDHSYYFIQTFINDHLEWHYRALSRS